MENVTHRDHVYIRQRIREEAAGLEAHAVTASPLCRDIILKDRLHLRKIEPDTLRCGFARAICVTRSPCAVPTSTTVLYCAQANFVCDRKIRDVG